MRVTEFSCPYSIHTEEYMRFYAGFICTPEDLTAGFAKVYKVCGINRRYKREY